MKLNLFSIFIFLFFAVACDDSNDSQENQKTNSEVPTDSPQSESKEKLEETTEEEEVETISFDDIVGKWSYEKNNQEINYFLEIKFEAGKLVGSHCFVLGRQGQKSDCSPEGYTLSCSAINDNKIACEIRSGFVSKPVKCLFGRKGDALELEVISDTEGAPIFSPNMVFVRFEMK